MKQTIALWNPQQGHKAIADLWPWLKSALMAGHKMTLEARSETRSTAQNSRLHAMLGELAKQCVWHGQKFPLETWKRLCMAAWLREERQSPMLIPALDGNGVDIIYERTSKLSVTQCGSLMEWVAAFGADQGIRFADDHEWIDQETGEIRQ